MSKKPTNKEIIRAWQEVNEDFPEKSDHFIDHMTAERLKISYDDVQDALADASETGDGDE